MTFVPTLPTTNNNLNRIFTKLVSRQLFLGAWLRRCTAHRVNLCADLESRSKFHRHRWHEMVRLEQHQCLPIDLLNGEVFGVVATTGKCTDEFTNIWYLYNTCFYINTVEIVTPISFFFISFHCNRPPLIELFNSN